MTVLRLGYNPNSLYTCMEPKEALDFIASMGLRFVELGMLPHSQYMMYGAEPQDFREFFQDMAEYMSSIGLSAPVVASWVRDNRDVASSDDRLHRAGVNILKCMIDVGEIVGARHMMSPAGTIRSYTDGAGRNARFERLLQGWAEASQYAYGTLDTLRIEQMSWADDPPQTIQQAAYMIEWLDMFRDANPESVPVHLHYDIGHGPTPPPANGDCPEYHPERWFAAFPGRIQGVHLKGCDPTRTSAFPLLWENPAGPSSKEIVGSLLRAIESTPENRDAYIDLIVEMPHLKERSPMVEIQKGQIRESVEVVKFYLGFYGYTEKDGVWTKIPGFSEIE